MQMFVRQCDVWNCSSCFVTLKQQPYDTATTLRTAQWKVLDDIIEVLRQTYGQLPLNF